MAILLKCGAIFLHIPKTGGNWVADVLEDNDLVFAHIGEKHSSMDQILEFEKWFRVPYKYSKPNKPFFKFCFVRHPLKWYESWFKMQTASGWPKWGEDPGVWHPNAMLDGLGDTDFNTFITNVLREHRGYLTRLYGWYTSPGVHFIGKQENLADDLVSVLKFLNVKFDQERIRSFKPVNASENMEIHWRPDLKEAIEQAEYAAFTRFGYKTKLYAPQGVQIGQETTRASRPDPNNTIHLPGPFSKEGGYAWQIAIPELGAFADGMTDPNRSMLVLLEDGEPLSLRHAIHDDVRQKGKGRYSHWGDFLLFSTSDNSDPNTNGRTYHIQFRFYDDFGCDQVMVKSCSSDQCQ